VAEKLAVSVLRDGRWASTDGPNGASTYKPPPLMMWSGTPSPMREDSRLLPAIRSV